MVAFGSPRHRRLLVLVASLTAITYFTLVAFPSKHVQRFHEYTEDITGSISTTFSEMIENYFTADDNNYILEQLTNSDLDLKDNLKEHLVQGPLKQANAKAQKFFIPLIKLMYEQKDMIPQLELTKLATDDKGAYWSKEQLLKYLIFDKDTIPTFKDMHSKIFEALPSEFPKDLYRGTGIVIIGGGQYTWLSMLSIKSLRSFGCKLPIEMIIPTVEEYEHDMCEEILPALGGKCVLLHNVFGEAIMEEIPFKGYQYKSLALIASSFENVLFLDSDNVLVTNPESYFTSEPFLSTGMITWPDYWERTTSPYMYEIMGIKVNETTRVRDGKWYLDKPQVVTDPSKVKFHDLLGAIPDLSSESGQLMIRKSDHMTTLLLSLFYNLFGPGFFYKLISQGFDGEGDKDTFIMGAIKGGEKFYQVHSDIKTFGWWDGDNFNGVAMGQRDPVEDYQLFKEFIDSGEQDFSKFDTAPAPVFTVHANFPKLNPFLLHTEKKLVNSKGKDFRMYSDISHYLPEKFDFEFVQYKRMKFLLCDLNMSFKYFNNISQNELCEFIEEHLQFLKDHPINV